MPLNEWQAKVESGFRLSAKAPMHQRIRTAAKVAKDIFEHRSFLGVSEESEDRCIKEAVLEQDYLMLLAFIQYGRHYQAGCVKRAVCSLREQGLEHGLSTHHLEATSILINAVLDAMRSNPYFDMNLQYQLEKRYTAIIDYAVPHYDEADFVASLIRDRKVDRLETVVDILNEVRAAPLRDGVL